jgi:hypothetical protein
MQEHHGGSGTQSQPKMLLLVTWHAECCASSCMKPWLADAGEYEPQAPRATAKAFVLRQLDVCICKRTCSALGSPLDEMYIGRVNLRPSTDST